MNSDYPEAAKQYVAARNGPHKGAPEHVHEQWEESGKRLIAQFYPWQRDLNPPPGVHELWLTWLKTGHRPEHDVDPVFMETLPEKEHRERFERFMAL